jgi:hypothetical protein
MKKIFYTTLLLIGLSTATVVAQGTVRLTIKDGIDGNMKSKIEKASTDLLTEINAAYTQKRALNTVKLNMTAEARTGLAALWENCHFYCDSDDGEVVELCMHTLDGFQIRNIPLMMRPRENVQMQDDEYKEGVIVFDKLGRIVRFNNALDINIWKNVMKNAESVKEVLVFEYIRGYVEHFRTAYEEKDLEFLKRVLSDDALIITGTVVRQEKTDVAIKMPTEKIKYTKKNKKQYLADLERNFKNNKWIRVSFDEYKIQKHPKYKDIYGVTVHQLYANSNGYGDDGYVFMLWDFRDKDNVQIHVRTWQPKWFNEEKTKELPQTEIFKVGEFDCKGCDL